MSVRKSLTIGLKTRTNGRKSLRNVPRHRRETSHLRRCAACCFRLRRNLRRSLPQKSHPSFHRRRAADDEMAAVADAADNAAAQNSGVGAYKADAVPSPDLRGDNRGTVPRFSQ